MAAERCSELLWALDRDPRAELEHGTVGQTEIFGGIAGARAHHHEQAFPPQRHALARRGHGGEAAEEIGHVIRVVVEAQPLMLVAQLQRARHLRYVHEAELHRDAPEAVAERTSCREIGTAWCRESVFQDGAIPG